MSRADAALMLPARAAASAIILAAALPLVACSGTGEHDLRNVEQQLSDKYLRPLSTAGLTYKIQDTCRLALEPTDPAWHLQATFLVDAAQGDVAHVLRAEGIRLNEDRNVIVVQQKPGDPESGWNGGLERAGAGTLLALTYNNADVDDVSTSGGWGEPCP